ncbi:MAG: ABC transporter substrate-binding protein, partial [Campylobacterales bacterium]|nr:ABC transporter substrate-binding protein [Campylobacterales bacterium]
MKVIFKIFIVSILMSNLLFSQSINNHEKVKLQLKWKYQFQFAGFITALEKGYYKDLGLDVELIEYDGKTDPLEQIKNSNIDFALGDSNLVLHAMENAPIVGVMAIFQESPYILIGLKSSNIKTLQDIEGKLVALSQGSQGITIEAMLKAHKVSYLSTTSIFKIEDLYDTKVELFTGYITNEPFIAEERNIDIITFNPKDYGFSGYGDILYTSKKFLKNHPRSVEKFYLATKKGWEYAFSNVDETVDLIYDKYNSLNKSKKSLYYEAI